MRSLAPACSTTSAPPSTGRIFLRCARNFPRVQLSDQVFSIDRDRYTCSGGTAPLDLMLNLIRLKLGPRVSQLVSEQFVLERVRNDQDRQYIPLRALRVIASQPDQGGRAHGGNHREAFVARQDCPHATGLSRRQIERLFNRHLDCVPKKYYLEMRLRRARELLLQTAMPITDITTSCGFKSPPISPAATATSSAIRRVRNGGSDNPLRQSRRDPRVSDRFRAHGS